MINASCLKIYWAFLGAQLVKNPSEMQENTRKAGAPGSILGQEDALEKEMATHSSISCLGNPMDREAWWAIVHSVTRVRHNLAPKLPPPQIYTSTNFYIKNLFV